MKSFVPRNYLADWPMPEIKFDSHPGLQVSHPFSLVYVVEGVGPCSGEKATSWI